MDLLVLISNACHLPPATCNLSVTILFAFSSFKAVSKSSLKNRCLLVLTQSSLLLWLSCFTLFLKLLLAHVENRLWWFYIPQLSESKCPVPAETLYRRLYTPTPSYLNLLVFIACVCHRSQSSLKTTHRYDDHTKKKNQELLTDSLSGLQNSYPKTWRSCRFIKCPSVFCPSHLHPSIV